MIQDVNSQSKEGEASRDNNKMIHIEVEIDIPEIHHHRIINQEEDVIMDMIKIKTEISIMKEEVEVDVEDLEDGVAIGEEVVVVVDLEEVEDLEAGEEAEVEAEEEEEDKIDPQIASMNQCPQ